MSRAGRYLGRVNISLSRGYRSAGIAYGTSARCCIFLRFDGSTLRFFFPTVGQPDVEEIVGVGAVMGRFVTSAVGRWFFSREGVVGTSKL